VLFPSLQDLFLPEEIFPGPRATSSLKDVLLDPMQSRRVPPGGDFSRFPGPQATSSLKDVLGDPREDLLLPEQICVVRCE
jgi:hypothetical protein